MWSEASSSSSTKFSAYYAQHRSQPPAEFSDQKVSGLTGAVQPTQTGATSSEAVSLSALHPVLHCIAITTRT